MELKLYDDEDIRKEETHVSFDGKKYPYAFIADVPGDNPDVLGEYDNIKLAIRLEEFKAITKGMKLTCEVCCFYGYFESLMIARAFIKKLNAYISQKSRLMREAQAF